MIFRFILGLMVGLLLGQVAEINATPLILVVLAYFIGMLHSNVLKKLEIKDAKK